MQEPKKLTILFWVFLMIVIISNSRIYPKTLFKVGAVPQANTGRFKL